MEVVDVNLWDEPDLWNQREGLVQDLNRLSQRHKSIQSKLKEIAAKLDQRTRGPSSLQQLHSDRIELESILLKCQRKINRRLEQLRKVVSEILKNETANLNELNAAISPNYNM